MKVYVRPVAESVKIPVNYFIPMSLDYGLVNVTFRVAGLKLIYEGKGSTNSNWVVEEGLYAGNVDEDILKAVIVGLSIPFVK